MIGSGSSATADGNLIFKGNWETGDTSQWSYAQCSNISTPHATRGSVAVVEDAVAEGRYAGRFVLPADASTRTQCEVLRRRSFAVGSEDYYGLALYFPAGWREPSSAFWGLMVAQLNFQGIWGAPLSVVAHGRYVTSFCKRDIVATLRRRLLDAPGTAVTGPFRETSDACT